MLAWVFLFVVLAAVGKLVYDIQQKKNKPTKTIDDFEFKDDFQKLAGITPVNPNDEIREILVKNNIIGKQQIIDALVKAAENSEFPKPDESINVRTTKIGTIDTNFDNDNDPLASVPMSRVSNEAKQKMAEIAKQDITNQLEQNAERFATLTDVQPESKLPVEIEKAMMEAPIVKPKRKYTKRKTSTK